MLNWLKKSLIISSTIISIPIVYAQVEDIASAFKDVADVLLSVLGGVAAFLEPLLPMFQDNPVLGRALLGVIIAIVLYMGIKDVDFIKKQEKGQTFAKAISIIIAIIAAIGIPDQIILGIFGTPTSPGWQLWLFVVCAIILLLSKGESRISAAFRGVAFLILGLGSMEVSKNLTGVTKTFMVFTEVIFILAGVYYLFYKVWTGLRIEGKGEEIGGAPRKVGKEIKEGVQALRGKTSKEEDMLKRLGLIGGREIENIQNIINSLEELKRFISEKGISDATREKLSDLISKIINKVKFGEQVLHTLNAKITDVVNYKTSNLTYKNLEGILKSKYGIKKIDQNQQNQIRALIGEYEKEVKEKLEDNLRAIINALAGEEINIRKKMNEFTGNINSKNKIEAIRNIDEIIIMYRDEETIISDLPAIEDKIRQLNDRLIADLASPV